MNAGTALPRMAASVLELLIAIGVFKAALFASYRLGCLVHPCYDLQGLGVLVYAVPFAAIVAIAYWVVALLMGVNWRRRLMLDGVAALVAIAGFVVTAK